MLFIICFIIINELRDPAELDLSPGHQLNRNYYDTSDRVTVPHFYLTSGMSSDVFRGEYKIGEEGIKADRSELEGDYSKWSRSGKDYTPSFKGIDGEKCMWNPCAYLSTGGSSAGGENRDYQECSPTNTSAATLNLQ